MRELTVEQKQALVSGVLGDGSLKDNGSCVFSCIHKDYMDYKHDLLGELANFVGVKAVENNGFKKGIIYRLTASASEYGKWLKTQPLDILLGELNELGFAMWMLDDGSLHKSDHFFNINTHAYSQADQEKYFLPYFNKLNIFPTIAYDRKKDGRVFCYLRVNKFDGAFEISNILNKYKVDSYAYKIIPQPLLNAYNEIKLTPGWDGIESNRTKSTMLRNFIKEKTSVVC